MRLDETMRVTSSNSRTKIKSEIHFILKMLLIENECKTP